MSNIFNDIVLEELDEMLPDLTPEQRQEVNQLIETDMEAAWEKAKFYHRQHTKAYLRELHALNPEVS